MLCTYGQEKHPNLRYEGPSSTMRALAHVGQKTNMATQTRLLSMTTHYIHRLTPITFFHANNSQSHKPWMRSDDHGFEVIQT